MDNVAGDPGDRDHPAAGADRPLTVELLADLQAGLLDDDTAAQVRNRVRADPVAAEVLDGLNRVRRDVAALNGGASPAPDVSPTVVACVAAALRSAGPLRGRPRAGAPAAHALRPPARPARVVAAVVGLAAAVVAVGMGTAALIAAPAPIPSEPTSVRHVTVSRTPVVIPLSDAQIVDLLGQTPDFGPLADPHHLASCLAGLGYPTTVQVLGAQLIEIAGRAGELLVFPADTPGTVTALAVAPTCSSADTGLLADRLVHRR